MSTYSILCQANPSICHSNREERIAVQVALLRDVRLNRATIEQLSEHQDALLSGLLLPVGSVEFVRAAMRFAAIVEPENLSYPDALQPYLKREIRRIPAGAVIGTHFVKPVTTKLFTGFSFDTFDNPEHLPFHDRAQLSRFLSLPPQTPVWVSQPVQWLSEVRHYVLEGEILGSGRYDEGADEAPLPDVPTAAAMAEVFYRSGSAPVAFSLDVGLMEDGTTALVECNDAWALGFYSGTIVPTDYVDLLWRRWQQLHTQSR